MKPPDSTFREKFREERHRLAFGQWFRAKREGRGKSLKKIAEAADVSAKAVSDLELGKIKCPAPSTLQGVANAVGLEDVAELQHDYDGSKARHGAGWKIIVDPRKLYQEFTKRMREVRKRRDTTHKPLWIAALHGLGEHTNPRKHSDQIEDYNAFDEELLLWAAPPSSNRHEFRMMIHVRDESALTRVEELFQAGKENDHFYLRAFCLDGPTLPLLCPLWVGEHVFITFDHPNSHRANAAFYLNLDSSDDGIQWIHKYMLDLWKSVRSPKGKSRSYKIKDGMTASPEDLKFSLEELRQLRKRVMEHVAQQETEPSNQQTELPKAARRGRRKGLRMTG